MTMLNTLYKDSNTAATLFVNVKCVAPKKRDCKLGCKDCSSCDKLVWLDMGVVLPQPEIK